MKQFIALEFDIPELKGISAKTTEEHLKLYAGYVKNTNLILEHIEELAKDTDPSASSGQAASTGSPQGGGGQAASTGSGQGKYAYELGELQRRFSFEFNGMRNHEYYFRSFVGGPILPAKGSALTGAIEEEWGSFDAWLARFKTIALTRGIGWAMLYFDPMTKRLLNAWVDEQHLGQLNGCRTILALDMWEHSYVADYQPSGKKKYIEDFFENLNWTVIEDNFKNAAAQD